MVLPLIGAGLMLGGTALNMYGTAKRDKAAKRALKDYQNAVGQRTAQEQAALGEQQQLHYGLAGDRQRGIGGYLTDLASAQYPSTDEGFQDRQTGALTNIKELTQGMDGTYAYEGMPRTQAESVQAGLTNKSNKRYAEAMLSDYTDRQIDEREKMAAHRMSFADLLRNTQGKSMLERIQLAKALRDLDWQKKTAAMQGQLDDAQRVGQTENLLGGLGTQAGSMLTMYGLGSGASGASGGSANGASTYGGGNLPGPAAPYNGSSSIYNFTG